MILLIDNYDSFVYNLARYVGELGYRYHVVRNDALSLDDIATLSPQAAILSPGPCTPDKAGLSLDFVRHFHQTLPMLGICLGHHCIAQAFGGRIRRAGTPRHGKTSPIDHNESAWFDGLPNPFEAARYHSLVADLPADGPLHPLATAQDDGELMAFHHRELPLVGYQFHPESVLTTCGHRLISNFLTMVKARPEVPASCRKEITG